MAIAVPTRADAPVYQPFQPLDIASDRCKACELCISVCPKDVLALDESVVNALGYHPIRLTDAAACTSCALLRPDLPRRRLHGLRPPEVDLT